MAYRFAARFQSSVVLLSLLAAGIPPIASAQNKIYNPIPLTPGVTVTDRLTNKDIPTGQGGFARDYVLQLKEGSQLAIDLTSDNFDTIVALIAEDGSTVAENDDGPDGSTNSLLFTRITKTGTYYIRVRAFGEVAGGNYKLKVTLLKPVEERR
ncbi:PPC domain-containing protein [Leptothermofonsia sichuanensis E412]|uniref:PPC domain-containing protein n=1 Tax=Leptothermofonsia sichuanensis TaxID=2917832 RepID=UPI001CA6B8AD|nr:PPC domain-containing protein [Leptothermofonsia sichuanensis]QZZ18980.1 PPC domain-containing protein [Leptothermofonsia sichuanensis E412]